MSFGEFVTRLTKLKISIKKIDIPIFYLVIACGFVPWLPAGTKFVTAFLVPPIESYRPIETATFLSGVIATVYACYWSRRFLKKAGARKLVLLTLVVLLVLQLAFWMKFVHAKENADGKLLTVVAGYKVKQSAVDAYGASADAGDMIHAEGPYDESVERIWTEGSVLITRIAGVAIYSMLGSVFTVLTAITVISEKDANISVDLDGDLDSDSSD